MGQRDKNTYVTEIKIKIQNTVGQERQRMRNWLKQTAEIS